MENASQGKGDLGTYLKNAYELFRMGAFGESEVQLERALALDFEHREVLSALKGARFWQERAVRYEAVSDEFERGEYLTKQWKAFLQFMERDAGGIEQGVFSIKQWVFGQALNDYIRLLDGPGASDPEILLRIGRCYKGKGNYKQALEYLEACNHQKTDDPLILAELADCYAFINEVKASKIFFREAFFLDPQRVDLSALESMLIRRLIQRLTELGFTDPGLAEWIPVYGVLYGVLNVKREMRSLEYGKLKQSIFTLESRIEEEGKTDCLVEPRLITRYFWLIDHYISAGDSREKIDDVLARLRKLNSAVYELYTN